MAQDTIHVLHLTRHWLRWATLEREPRKFVLLSKGEILGEAGRCLDEWAQKQAHPPGEIHLYDGRPMVYQFTLCLPRQARGQAESAIKLRIRQELGLGEEAVCWASRVGVAAHDARQLEYATSVVRREALSDLRQWQARHALTALWVGADLCAVDTLFERAAFDSPVVLLNACDQGATLFVREARGTVGKIEVGQHGASDQGWVDGAERSARLQFGRSDVGAWLRACPPLAALEAAPALRWRNGHGTRLAGLAPELLAFDPVILGGIARLEADGPSIESLLRDETPRPALSLSQWKETPRLRRRIKTIAVLGLLLAVSLGGVRHQRAVTLERLGARAARLRPTTERLKGQQAVLQRIKTDRAAALMPVLEAIHQAAPPGLALQSLSLNVAGSVRLQGTVPSPEMANTLFSAIAASGKFDPGSVQLQEVKQGERGITFQLTASIKGRAKR